MKYKQKNLKVLNMKLTQLIQDMIDTNAKTQQQLETTNKNFKDLENIVYENTSDKNILDLMQNNFTKSQYFYSQEFYEAIAQGLINKYGLGNLVTLDREQTHKAIHEYLVQNFNIDSMIQELLKHYDSELRDAMIRRIRIESKSILDNYDFTYTIMPRLEEYIHKFMKEHNLTQFLIEQTAKLFVAQQSNINFMLEYYLSDALHK